MVLDTVEQQQVNDDAAAHEDLTTVKEPVKEHEIDLLLNEVEKELHTRFKNMFEDNMLLPNLEFNPDFEG